MRITDCTTHLTQGRRRHLKHMIEQSVMSGQIGRIRYWLEPLGGNAWKCDMLEPDSRGRYEAPYAKPERFTFRLVS